MVRDGQLWLGMVSYGYGQLGMVSYVKDGQLWLWLGMISSG